MVNHHQKEQTIFHHGSLCVFLFAFILQANTVGASHKYDAIIVGAGAGGCSLAQTLVEEKNKKVLLLERGGEKPPTSFHLDDVGAVLIDNDCVDVFDGDGVSVAVGNCLGGATTFNQGIWIEEQPDFLAEVGGMFSNIEMVKEAFEHVRNAISPNPTSQVPGSPADEYITELIDTFARSSSIPLYNVTPGNPTVQENGYWRGHSSFEPGTGNRITADTLLDRNNPNLEIRLHTEVTKILFQTGSSYHRRFRCRNFPSSRGCTATPRATCVRLANGKDVCVKDGTGRIYLAASAFHTPALLIKSGIGRSGFIFDNPEVGQGLSDKVMYPVATYFKPEFSATYSENSFASVVATKTITARNGASKTLLFEEISMGHPGSFVDLLRFERLGLSPSIRQSKLFDPVYAFSDFCTDTYLEKGSFNAACEALVGKITKHSCFQRINALIAFQASPSSRGSVTVDRRGRVVVSPNYLDTDDDKEAFGASVQTAYDIITSRTGPTGPDQPCRVSGVDCSESCPDLLGEFVDLLSIRKPYPNSQVFPKNAEPLVESFRDNFMAIAQGAAASILSPHHFVGTAAIGRVVDNELKVIGVDGLYVADASVMPSPPRVNTMPSTMMIGRMAGLMFD